jgi:hypothetical protein
VLQHVRGKQARAERIQRRHEREHQSQPAACERSGVHAADAAADARIAPQAQHAQRIPERRQCQEHQHPWLERPLPQHRRGRGHSRINPMREHGRRGSRER